MGRRTTGAMDAMEAGAGRTAAGILAAFGTHRRREAVGIVTVTLCVAGVAGLLLHDYAAQRREDRETARILTQDGVRADLPIVRVEVDEDSRARPSSVVLRLPDDGGGGEVTWRSERIPGPALGVGERVAVLYSPSHPGVAAPSGEVIGRTRIRSDSQMLVALRVVLGACVVPLVAAGWIGRHRDTLQK